MTSLPYQTFQIIEIKLVLLILVVYRVDSGISVEIQVLQRLEWLEQSLANRRDLVVTDVDHFKVRGVFEEVAGEGRNVAALKVQELHFLEASQIILRYLADAAVYRQMVDVGEDLGEFAGERAELAVRQSDASDVVVGLFCAELVLQVLSEKVLDVVQVLFVQAARVDGNFLVEMLDVVETDSHRTHREQKTETACTRSQTNSE